MVKILDNPSGAHSHDAVAMQQRQAGWQGDAGTSLTKLAKTNTAGSGDLDVEVTGTPTGGASATTTFTYTAGTATTNPKLTITVG